MKLLDRIERHILDFLWERMVYRNPTLPDSVAENYYVLSERFIERAKFDLKYARFALFLLSQAPMLEVPAHSPCFAARVTTPFAYIHPETIKPLLQGYVSPGAKYALIPPSPSKWIITELMTVFLLWLPYITGSTRKHLDLGIFMSVCGALTVLFTICAWSSADDERRKKIADG